jgi:iron complex outermembrane recepter protein
MRVAHLFVLLFFQSLLAFGQENARPDSIVSFAGKPIEVFIFDLDEFIVTAQKRTETIKAVPISLSTITTAFLERNVVESMGGMAAFVPGVQVQEQSVLYPGFVIRGLTSDYILLNTDNRVSVFQDGVSISKQIGAAVEFFDMDRVEVLKGPQGTLFGRSAQIGAIHLITNRAQNETSGSFALGTGNYKQLRANGYVNLPLVENKLFLRLAGIYNKRDGYVENLSGGTLMGKNSLANRVSLSYEPDKYSTVDLSFNYQRDRPTGTAFKSGRFAPAGGDTDPFTFVDHEAGNDLVDRRDVYGITSQHRRSFGEGLSITTITGYRNVNSEALVDSDGTKAQALGMEVSIVYNQFSQEVRFNLDRERVMGFAGVNYFREQGHLKYVLEHDERSYFAMLSPMLANAIPGLQPVPLIVDGEPNLSVSVNPLTGRALKPFHTESSLYGAGNNAFDVFADGTYKLTEKLWITAGGRLIMEDLSAFLHVDPADDPGTLGFILRKGPNNLFGPTDGKIEERQSFTDWVGRTILQYELSEQVSTYASWSKGRRPNVIQVMADTAEVLKAERVHNYELGVKTLFLNKRIQLNMSGFLYNYSHFQTRTLDLEGGSLIHITDSGMARGMGVETDTRIAVTRNLRVFASHAWLHARFNDKDALGNPQELAGNTFRLSPKHSGAAGLSCQFELGGAGYIDADMSVTFKSGHYFEDDNDPDLYQSGFALVNAALQYTTANKKHGGRLNVSNIFNNRYLIDAGNAGLLFGIPTFVPGPPRFIGMQLFSRF